MKIKSDNFLNYIKQPSLDFKFILLYGNNFGLVNLLYNEVINALGVDINDPFNVSKFDSQKVSNNPHLIFDTISTISIFSDKRTILLDLCGIPLKKSVIEAIKVSICSNNDKYNIIIKADNLGSSNELVMFTQSSSLGVLVPCYEDTIINVKDELLNILREHNLQFNESFLSNLSAKFSSDSSVNRMEFDKLRNFLINNEIVTEETLLNLITDNTVINLNKISSYCAMGDVKNALFFYNKSIDSGSSSVSIIRSLVKYFKIIENILCLINDGKNINDAINSINPPIFFKDKFLFHTQSKIWNLKKINIVLKRLVIAEIKCKSTLFGEKILIAQLILSLSVMAKNSIKT